MALVQPSPWGSIAVDGGSPRPRPVLWAGGQMHILHCTLTVSTDGCLSPGLQVTGESQQSRELLGVTQFKHSGGGI